MNAPDLAVTPSDLVIVHAILRRHVPDRTVWAFGSRAKGAAKKFFDLDLAPLGDEPLPIATMAELAEAFSGSDLPYKVDLVDWATTAESFRGIMSSCRDRPSGQGLSSATRRSTGAAIVLIC